MEKHILIVEDEQRLAEILADYLKLEKYKVSCLYSGEKVINFVKKNNVDLIILDQMLPIKDGFTILKELRAFSELPVIMATAKVEEIDRLLGLEFGADDYICKPFSFREVVARVKAVLRRTSTNRTNVQKNYESKNESHNDLENIISFSDDDFSATINNHKIFLTVIEFNLLKTLVDNHGKILSRKDIMTIIYPDHRKVSNRTIDSHIRKLRHKIDQSHNDINSLIQAVYSAGYKFIYKHIDFNK